MRCSGHVVFHTAMQYVLNGIRGDSSIRGTLWRPLPLNGMRADYGYASVCSFRAGPRRFGVSDMLARAYIVSSRGQYPRRELWQRSDSLFLKARGVEEPTEALPDEWDHAAEWNAYLLSDAAGLVGTIRGTLNLLETDGARLRAAPTSKKS